MDIKKTNKLYTPIGKDTRTDTLVGLTYQERLNHTIVLGEQGAGKLYNTLIPMIHNDIKNNTGVIVISPTRELTDTVNATGTLFERETLHFNPLYKNSATFNPLYGDESTVVVTLTNAFKSLVINKNDAIVKLNVGLLSNAIKVIKRTYGDDATLIELYELVTNIDGAGVKILNEFMDKKFDSEHLTQENRYLCEWFIRYLKGDTTKGKETQKYSLLLRFELSKLIKNKHLITCLTPKKGEKPDIIFSEVIAQRKVISINTGGPLLKDSNNFLNYLLAYQLNSEISKHNTTIDEFSPAMIYIDEAQVSLKGEMLSFFQLCTNQNIGLILSGESPIELKNKIGTLGARYIFKNCKNKIIYPYQNDEDYDELINTLNSKDIILARRKYRNAHYHIESGAFLKSGVCAINSPDLTNEYYSKITHIKSEYSRKNEIII